MLSIAEIIAYRQPDIFARLKGMLPLPKRKNEVVITFEEAERLMRHASYKRVSGAVRQRK